MVTRRLQRLLRRGGLAKKLAQVIDRILERVSNSGLIVSGILILLMAFLSTYGVTRRYVLNNPESYSYELSIIFLVGCCVLSIAAIQWKKLHLRVDFIANHLPENVKLILSDILLPLMGLFYIGIMTWQSWDNALYSLRIGESSQSVWGEPYWPTKMVVTVGAGLLCLVLISQLVRGVTSLIHTVKRHKTETNT